MFYCYQILCLACLIIWMHTKNIYSYSSLIKCFSLPQKFCVVYIHLTGYQMKVEHIGLIYILINEN